MLALALALALAPPASPVQRLVTGSGLRARAAPDTNAAVVEKVPLGAALPCLEESAPVTAGAVTAPFCRMASGWYFTALTEPLAPAQQRAAQLDALVQRRAQELAKGGVDESRYPDVYALHALLLRLVDERTGDARLRARIAELEFVAAYARAFAKDPRVVRDDSQGERVKNEAFEALVAQAKGTAVHEDAAWALYQHGMGGECEGDPTCVFVRLHRTACRFLEAFPEGARAAQAVDDIAQALRAQAAFEAQAPEEAAAVARDASWRKDTRDALAKVKACVARARSGDTQEALALVDAALGRYR